LTYLDLTLLYFTEFYSSKLQKYYRACRPKESNPSFKIKMGEKSRILLG
jgi:hypothetical protein